MTREYSTEEIADKDRRFVWHPFTQMQEYMAADPVIVERGEGIQLIDVNGRAYYDGVSSLWLNVHGHCVPEINAAITTQLDRIAHSTLLGCANVPSACLAEKLVSLTPASLTRVFYSDSGSEAVEIGLKIAYQYWRQQGDDHRRYFVNMTDAYHGDTVGSVSVGGIDLFHRVYSDLLFPTLSVPYPHPYRFDGTPAECARHCLDELDRVLAERHSEIIGLIVEPIVQGAAGMIVMPDGYLKGIENRCREFEILLLTDEVATGWGRTGPLFACEHEAVKPDILMTAKGLTGGYLPLAATLTADHVFDAFLGDYSEQKTFFHGHSYTGNQLCCAAALASIDLFEKRNLIDSVRLKSETLAARLQEFANCAQVGDVRGKGFMWGVELVRDKATKLPYGWEERMGIRVCNRCRELGMILRSLGNVVVFMPPLASSEKEIEEMIGILHRAIVEVTE